MISGGQCQSVQQVQQSDSTKERRERLGEMHKNFARMAAMPWNRRRARLNEIQLQRTNGTLSTQLLQLREQLRNKERYASGLEILLRQRNERIDQLQGPLDQLRFKNNQSHEEAQHMAMFVGMM